MIRRYMRADELASEFGVSVDRVRAIVRIIRRNIKQGRTRYGPLDIVGSGRAVSIRTAAYIDCAKYCEYINTDMEQRCPMYNPDEIEYDLHLADRPPEIDIEAVAAAVIASITNRLKGERT